jgi:hypothetical protein
MNWFINAGSTRRHQPQRPDAERIRVVTGQSAHHRPDTKPDQQDDHHFGQPAEDVGVHPRGPP